MTKFWNLFHAPDSGGDAGGAPPAGGEGASEGQPAPQGEKPEDVSGLKSALEKERAARKELQGQLKELRDLSGKGEEAEKKAAELAKKLAEYEFRDTRDAALAKAIEAATKDGKFVVDREKAAKLAGKLANAATLEGDVAEIVDLLKAEAGPAKKAEPALKGQPSGAGNGKTTELPYNEWARLKREDPEAYDAMMKQRRASGGYRIMGN